MVWTDVRVSGQFIAVLKNMFKFGYGCYVIRRNNAIPFVNGGISASIRSEQPQWKEGHEAVYSIRLYNFIIVYLGASSKSLDKSSANHITSIPKQDNSYRDIIMIIAIISLNRTQALDANFQDTASGNTDPSCLK
jgi:hypothetical protein